MTELTQENLLDLQAEMIRRYNEAIQDLQAEFKAHAELLRLDYNSAMRTNRTQFDEHVAKVAEHNKMLDDKADAREAEYNKKHAETICHNDKTQRLIALASLQAANLSRKPEEVYYDLQQLELTLAAHAQKSL